MLPVAGSQGGQGQPQRATQTGPAPTPIAVLEQENKQLKMRIHDLSQQLTDEDRKIRIEASQKDLDRLTTWVANTETRLVIVFTAQIGVLAVTAGLGVSVYTQTIAAVLKLAALNKVPHFDTVIWPFFIVMLCGGYILLYTVVAFLELRLLLSDQLNSARWVKWVAKVMYLPFAGRFPMPSEVTVTPFYLAVARSELSDFNSRESKKTGANIDKDLIERIHAESNLIKRRVSMLSYCYRYLLIQVVLLGVLLIVSAFLGLLLSA